MSKIVRQNHEFRPGQLLCKIGPGRVSCSSMLGEKKMGGFWGPFFVVFVSFVFFVFCLVVFFVFVLFLLSFRVLCFSFFVFSLLVYARSP